MVAKHGKQLVKQKKQKKVSNGKIQKTKIYGRYAKSAYLPLHNMKPENEPKI